MLSLLVPHWQPSLQAITCSAIRRVRCSRLAHHLSAIIEAVATFRRRQHVSKGGGLADEAPARWIRSTFAFPIYLWHWPVVVIIEGSRKVSSRAVQVLLAIRAPHLRWRN
jgi:hypothetical protein